jgi:hypothetical protein
MPRSKTPIVSLEEAKARFEEWRQNRRGRAAIPDELWAAAVEVARKEGFDRTATELHVEWNELKPPNDGATSRLAASSAADICGTDSTATAIVSEMHDRTGRPAWQASDPA